MTFETIANAVVILGAIAVLVVVLVRSSLRMVADDERLVVYRGGRPLSRAFGPGRVLLIPYMDRVVRVSLAAQHIELDAVPVGTADGRGVSVDLTLDFRVVRPTTFAWDVIHPFSAGLRLLARSALAQSAASLSIGDALTRATLEAAVVPAIEQRLAFSGASDVVVRVTRVREVEVSEEAERAALAELGRKWMSPDPDTAGSHTLAGDVAWAIGRMGRMAPVGIALGLLVTIGVQVTGFAGFRPWTPGSLIVGLAIGIVFGSLMELYGFIDLFRKTGLRRAVFSVVMLAAVTTAVVGALILVIIVGDIDLTRD